jgi:large subunit ribosomal protein L14
MIIFHTKLNIADNSGGRFGQCIKVLKGAYASIGNIVVVVIKELRRTIKQKKIQKSSIYKGIIIRVKKKSSSLINTYSSFDDNAIVLINASNRPIGSRIYGCVPFLLRKKRQNKILSIARIIS